MKHIKKIRRVIRIRNAVSRIKRFDNLSGLVKEKGTALFTSKFGKGYMIFDWKRQVAIYVFWKVAEKAVKIMSKRKARRIARRLQND